RRQERVTDRWQPVGSGRYFFGCRRKEHVAAELPRESATATDPYAAALAGGGGCSIGQRRGRVAAVPADVESTRLRPVLEAAGEECPLDIAGVEPIAIDRSATCRVSDPRNQSRAVRAPGRVPAGDVRRTRNRVDQRQQRYGSKHAAGRY